MRIGRTRLLLKRGDITKEPTDEIVNAANSTLLGGGGVDGAIHAAGGPAILEACRAIRATRGECPTGDAVVTTAGDLRASWVVHTVGPIWRGGDADEPRLLASCYRESLERAREQGARTIAFPSVSTGAYGYPIADAARVALGAVVDWARENPDLVEFRILPRPVDEIRFVLFSEGDLRTYQAALEEIEA